MNDSHKILDSCFLRFWISLQMSQIDIQPNLFTAHKDLQEIYCDLLNGVDSIQMKLLAFGLSEYD